MKKLSLLLGLSFSCTMLFAQHAETAKKQLKDPNTIENAAKADASLIDKKTVKEEPKRKKPRRAKNKKECSRMKT
jgi:hypothetical protein